MIIFKIVVHLNEQFVDKELDGLYAVEKSKDPVPEAPTLISPQLPARRAYSSERGVEFALDSGWNGGIMEYWKSKTDDDQILNSVPCHPHKNRSHSAIPIIPTLQYSIIPLCWITAQPIFYDPAPRTRFSVIE
jgi:hypothetical protein